jgi:hypothetical protein
MSYSNANYLTNPNRLSTKVHYAPGGASSLSLAWDAPVLVRQEKPRIPLNGYSKQQTEPNANYGQQSPQWQEQKGGKNYYEAQNQGYQHPMGHDSNRILEE